MMNVLKSVSVFVLAGLLEIGGGYLVWQWLKEGKPIWYGVAGAFILAMYGVVATWQTVSFGRAYAAYGGIFILMALIWAWKIDGFKPDRWDVIGALIAVIGACIIIYMPRNR
ncbi:YnfA family protein [Mucilaginibacter robiniae]|uniref:YnfA family protein n=1 Tax=Mucilaginibacter robiniae TaxID=2728022 RepID=A0A7L5E2Y9_9SPHI|nr:YnfA family protein [Mucilaginibacter robiniae]QJD96014.1 YnfA family protein [Mucilaginibacter robiniae]